MEKVYRIKVSGYVSDGWGRNENYNYYKPQVYGTKERAEEEAEYLRKLQDEYNESVLRTSMPFDHDEFIIEEQEVIF
jgi:hypothetical protein